MIDLVFPHIKFFFANVGITVRMLAGRNVISFLKESVQLKQRFPQINMKPDKCVLQDHYNSYAQLPITNISCQHLFLSVTISFAKVSLIDANGCRGVIQFSKIYFL